MILLKHCETSQNTPPFDEMISAVDAKTSALGAATSKLRAEISIGTSAEFPEISTIAELVYNSTDV